MSRGKTRSRIRVESLENRCTPAGTVHVSAALGTINITGDPADNRIKISPGAAQNSIKIEALDANTTITGTAEVDATNQKVNVVLGAGDDRVSFEGTLNLQQLTVNLGTGNNELDIGGTFSVAGDLKVLQAGTPGITTTATVDIAPTILIGSFNVGGGFSYQSTGDVDDTVNVAVGSNSSDIDGAISAMLGAGTNTFNIQSSGAKSISVVSQSAAPDTFGINVNIPTIDGNATFALGRADGSLGVSSNSIGGNVSISNLPAKQSVTVAVSGNTVVSEKFTVNLSGDSANLNVTANGVFGNVSITNRGTKQAYVNANIVTITGSSFLAAVQPQASGAGSNISATLTSNFVQKDLRVTTTGPGAVNTTIQPGVVNGNVNALSRGTEGTYSFTSTQIGRLNPVPAAGNVRMTIVGIRTEANANLGTVVGSSVVTITDSIFPTVKAAETKNALITIAGASVAAVETTKVLETFSVSVRDASSVSVLSTDIGGNATVRTNNIKPTITLGNIKGNVLFDSTVAEKSAIQVGHAEKDVTLNLRGNMPGSTVADATISNSSIVGTLRINQFASSSDVKLDHVTVGKDLIQRAAGKLATTSMISGSVAGTASFGGALAAFGSHHLNIDDATLNNVTYFGGAGRSVLLIDTDETKIFSTQINGNFTGVFGSGNDDVQLGDQFGGGQSPFERVDFAATSLVNLNGGLGTDRLANVNSDLDPANLTRISIDLQTTPLGP